MKTNMKKIGFALIGAALSFVTLFAAPRAQAKSLQELQVADLSKTKSGELASANTSYALRLTYVGSSTEAVVTIASRSVIGYAPAGVADTSFGTAGTYLLSAAAYDTMGEFCDAVDALADYKCALLGAKRDDNSNLLRDQTAASGTNDLKANGGFQVVFDTGSGVGAETQAYVERIGITPKDGYRILLKTCTANANVAGTLTVYGKLRKYEGVSDGITRNDSTLVWSKVTADDTDLTIPVTQTFSGFLDFATNAHVVVSAGNGTGVQAAANFLECQHEEISE